MLKVMTLVGTRPELIKMSRVIAELERRCNHVLVHTGQNHDYELNQIFFEDLEIRKPDYFLDAARETSAQTIAEVIARSDEVFAKERPDALLLYGDTNSCLAVIPAKRRKIPVFHMEAGNRCFDQRVPEELNRKVVDHLADINLVLTEHARRYLIAEGIRQETILKTGSHMREVLDYYLPRVRQSDILERLGLEPRRYLLVSAHREENVDSDDGLADLLDSLNALAQEYRFPILFSTHPRTAKRLARVDKSGIDERIVFNKPFGFLDYIHLQMHAFCILSDSGTITEEASLLNLPAVTIRQAHERPEGMDVGTLVMSGLKPARVLEAVKLVTEHHREASQPILPVRDYENPHVSRQIVRIVQSYVDYVRRTVWQDRAV
jgi:UDP-N-acetylglucosamine 2-epimerase (non-hydrolysing)